MKQDTKKIYIRTFGCQMNDRDSEVIYGLMLEKGWERAESVEKADCILFNTCSVRHHAEQRAYSNMGSLAKLKRRRPDIILGFIGCTAQKDKKIVFDRLPHVDIVTGPGEIYELPHIVEKILKKRQRILAVERTERPDRKNPILKNADKCFYVSISEGCDNYCSYCIVPYVRGRQMSRFRDFIISEIEEAASLGFKEVTLLGQNVNSYTDDRYKEYHFVSLLKDVHAIDKIERIRFVTCHPKDTNEGLFKAMRDLPKVYKHLHLPLQSGSDKILKAMKRGYTSEHYLSLVDKLREYIPGCNLTTDIIVGFPEESDEDFMDTYRIMDKIKFDAAYIFKYSPRPPAKSSEIKDDVAEETKKARHLKLLNLQKDVSIKKRKTHSDRALPMA